MCDPMELCTQTRNMYLVGTVPLSRAQTKYTMGILIELSNASCDSSRQANTKKQENHVSLSTLKKHLMRLKACAYPHRDSKQTHTYIHYIYIYIAYRSSTTPRSWLPIPPSSMPGTWAWLTVQIPYIGPNLHNSIQ